MATEGAGSIKELDPNNPGSNAPAGEGDDHLRMIKDVVKVSFPELDGLITNANGDGSPGNTNPPDAATFSRLFTIADEAFEQRVPIGGIIMWSGTDAQIPSGWVLCDGTNNTPDLRDRFILASSSESTIYPTGSNGGQAWDTSGAFPLMKTSDSPDATQTVNADVGSSNAQVMTRDHGHWYLPRFYALAFIMYRGT